MCVIMPNFVQIGRTVAVAVCRFLKMAAVRYLIFVMRLFAPLTNCILAVSVTVQNRLDRALILLGLAVFRAHLCLRCTWCYM